jgi:hypothetical protein
MAVGLAALEPPCDLSARPVETYLCAAAIVPSSGLLAVA